MTLNWYQLTEKGLTTQASLSQSTQESCQQSHPLGHGVRGLTYGDGFFTTIGVYRHTMLWQSYHQARITHHLTALYLYLPQAKQQLLWRELKALMTTVADGIIKIIIVRDEQTQRGYAHSCRLQDNTVTVWVCMTILSTSIATKSAQFLISKPECQLSSSTSDLTHSLTSTVTNKACFESVILQQPAISAICLQQKIACLPPPLAGLKSLNRLDSVLIAAELEHYKKRDPSLREGLVRDMDGNWVEGAMSNVFYQLKSPVGAMGRQWYTPPIDTSGVRGVMRQVIIDKLAEQGRPVKLRALKDDDLGAITALFFCNAVRGVMPVQQLRYDVKGDRTITLSLPSV